MIITLVAWYDHIARETSWVVTPRTRVRETAQTTLLQSDGKYTSLLVADQESQS
ncbi:MAG: hypothetical protein AAFW70_25185 [Cyanobacteria bacterium J06635_10]